MIERAILIIVLISFFLFAKHLARKPLEKKERRILSIEGMHCLACAERVKASLESIEGVKATVDLPKGRGRVELEKDIDNYILLKAVKDAGCKATDIEIL